MDDVTSTLEVLTEDELAAVVGGADVNKINREYVLSKVGMCGCGLAH